MRSRFVLSMPKTAGRQEGCAPSCIRTNGGQTWSLQLGGGFVDPGNRYPFEGLDVIIATSAMAVGVGNSIYTTSNGGALWINRGSGSGTIPFRVARDRRKSPLGGELEQRSPLYDQRRKEMGPLDHPGLARLRDVLEHGRYRLSQQQRRLGSHQWRFHNFELGVAQPGRRKDMANLERDRHWTPQRVGNRRCPDAGRSERVHRLNIPKHEWRHHLDVRSTPGGGSWFGSVRFVPGTQTGWTVGEGGKILKSTDGGATWTLQRSALHSFNLIDVSFADVNNGWTVGGEELHTTNGGTTWVNQNTGVFASVSVYAISPTTAWIGGLAGPGPHNRFRCDLDDRAAFEHGLVLHDLPRRR